ncbi:MAG: gliding motility-associated C-terminal domain-containing protein [Salinivirgaceae bacterium]
MMNKFFLIVVFVFAASGVYATHNRAGEITYKQVSTYTFEFTITTFTNTKVTSDGQPPADRDKLTIQWGDGTLSELSRVGKYELGDYYQKNIYLGQHTFLGPGTFEIVVEDPNRNEGVQNIPNSVLTVFSIKTVLQINPTLGFNNTPILLNPPVDKAAVGQIFIHNPSAFDPDGDSLSYEMAICTGENGEPIENYQFPPSSNKPIYIEEASGNLIWDSPTEPGAYNVAFHIYEWRQGYKIGRLTRDMQIEVYETDNQAPKIDSLLPVCITAGTKLSLPVTAHDSDDKLLTLTATGGIFNLDEPALFTSESDSGTVSGLLEWTPQCTDVRLQPYTVVFKVSDNNSEVNLVDLMSVDIQVIAPAPENLQLSPTNNSITLNWDSYACSNNLGYAIYRSTIPFGFTPDSCETGVPVYTGFTKIQELLSPADTQFIDNNNNKGLNQGYTYCYLITALFSNDVESKASNEVCTELVRGVPIITHVSVTKHDSTHGEIWVQWSKPLELDTIKFPGPHKYLIKRATGIWGTNYQLIDSLNSLNDTVYRDTAINTLNTGYSYQIEIHNPNGLTEWPMTASSIFPIIDASDKTLQLTFEQNTPWTNYQYTVFRQNKETNDFDSIGLTQNLTFVDFPLQNKERYSYRITSYGKYDLPGIYTPLINYSHTNSGMPIDTIPPLAPVLNVISDCYNFYNLLQWQILDDITAIRKYNIYFSTDSDSEYLLIDSVVNRDTLHYRHYAGDNPTGCYKVTAVDSNYNESPYSNWVCVDQCSYYELPNVFTPNNDGSNDTFVPLTPPDIVSKFIDKIDLKIYSRWGNLVFSTENPQIEWDGKANNSNIRVAPGVYYYVCDVYEKRISGLEHRVLTGFVHIFHNDEKVLPE